MSDKRVPEPTTPNPSQAEGEDPDEQESPMPGGRTPNPSQAEGDEESVRK